MRAANSTTTTPSASSRTRPMDVLTTAKLPLAEWLAIVEREYLADFLPAGGAAVKFAIVEDNDVAHASAGLLGLGYRRGMLAVAVDAAQTRLHMMQELFVA